MIECKEKVQSSGAVHNEREPIPIVLFPVSQQKRTYRIPYYMYELQISMYILNLLPTLSSSKCRLPEKTSPETVVGRYNPKGF